MLLKKTFRTVACVSLGAEWVTRNQGKRDPGGATCSMGASVDLKLVWAGRGETVEADVVSRPVQ